MKRSTKILGTVAGCATAALLFSGTPSEVSNLTETHKAVAEANRLTASAPVPASVVETVTAPSRTVLDIFEERPDTPIEPRTP